MIDDMVALLKKEEAADHKKKDYCESELSETDLAIKSLHQDMSDLDKAIGDVHGKLDALVEEIKWKEASIENLDKQVAAATQQRKGEHQEFMECVASNNAAKEILTMAKDRLGQVYGEGKPARAAPPPPKATPTTTESPPPWADQMG